MRFEYLVMRVQSFLELQWVAKEIIAYIISVEVQVVLRVV